MDCDGVFKFDGWRDGSDGGGDRSLPSCRLAAHRPPRRPSRQSTSSRPRRSPRRRRRRPDAPRDHLRRRLLRPFAPRNALDIAQRVPASRSSRAIATFAASPARRATSCSTARGRAPSPNRWKPCCPASRPAAWSGSNLGRATSTDRNMPARARCSTSSCRSSSGSTGRSPPARDAAITGLHRPQSVAARR